MNVRIVNPTTGAFSEVTTTDVRREARGLVKQCRGRKLVRYFLRVNESSGRVHVVAHYLTREGLPAEACSML